MAISRGLRPAADIRGLLSTWPKAGPRARETHASVSVFAVFPIPALVMPMPMAAPVFRSVIDRRRFVVHRCWAVVRRRRWRRGRAVVLANGRFVVDGRRGGVDGGRCLVVQRRTDADGPVHFGIRRSCGEEATRGHDGGCRPFECRMNEAHRCLLRWRDVVLADNAASGKAVHPFDAL